MSGNGSSNGNGGNGRRVVVTGIGAITPIGLGVEGLWDGLRRRTSAVRCITRFDPTVFKSRIAGDLKPQSPRIGPFPASLVARRLDHSAGRHVATSR